MVFIFFKGCLKKREREKRVCDRDHTCPKFSHLAFPRKCLLTPVVDPKIFVQRGGRGGEGALEMWKEKKRFATKIIGDHCKY